MADYHKRKSLLFNGLNLSCVNCPVNRIRIVDNSKLQYIRAFIKMLLLCFISVCNDYFVCDIIIYFVLLVPLRLNDNNFLEKDVVINAAFTRECFS